MKLKLLTTFIIASSLSTYVNAVDVMLADSKWDGMKIPNGQQCQKFGGQNPATPKLQVTGIPKGSDLIVLEYSDRDSKKMNNGGHGRMSYNIESMSESVVIASVAGHSFELPNGFTMIEKHRGAGWDIEGAYMPPCSGGKGHAYYITVKTMKGDKVTAETVLEMGKF